MTLLFRERNICKLDFPVKTSLVILSPKCEKASDDCIDEREGEKERRREGTKERRSKGEKEKSGHVWTCLDTSGQV